LDEIEIKHTAKNRDGFAIGALIAGKWVIGKQGVFSMQDVLAK
ncbi:4-hydroxy-tetrahydrodipicolinate reductase, partial [Flavobacteriales bacterium]|nr:4-hydroxy-tetrahydrodipicolinate reductase [Flavobacteriales bacterium]